MRILAQRQAHHLGAEVGAADADVDDVGDRFAGVAEPGAAAHRVAERFYARQHAVHVARDVLAVHRDRLAFRGAQGGVQDGTVFGGVDLFAGEHRVAQRLDPALARQVLEQFKRAPVEAVF
jgi:hypothetical protein